MAPAYQNEWLCDELAEELEALKVAHEELKVAHEKVQAENKRLKEGVVSTPKVFTPPVLCFDIMDMVGEKVAEVRERRALEEHRKKYRAVVEEQRECPHSTGRGNPNKQEMRGWIRSIEGVSEGVKMIIYRQWLEQEVEEELYNRAHHPELSQEGNDYGMFGEGISDGLHLGLNTLGELDFYQESLPDWECDWE